MSASIQNALLAFLSTGIVAFNPTIIPNHAFLAVSNKPENQCVYLQKCLQRPQQFALPQQGPSKIQSLHIRKTQENKSPQQSVSRKPGPSRI